MARIVILGAGLGGVMAAFEIRKSVRPEDEVTIINENAFYQFVPSNPWVLVGWRAREDILVDLVKPMKKRNIDLVVGTAQAVEPDARRIRLSDGRDIAYDYLVIATGPELAFDEIDGLGPEGSTQSVCHIDHAVQANTAFEAFCSDPGPIIVGAVQGASCFGPAYETLMIIETELRRRKIRDRVPMTYVTSEPYIGHLGLDGVGDTRSLLESELRERHIKWITNARVIRAEPGRMVVEELGEDAGVKQLHDLPMKFSMMLPAFRGVGAVRGIEGLTNPRGFILTDRHQRNPKYPEIFGIGVCIAIAPIGKTPVPVGVPKTGFMIESMVTASARNLGQVVRGELATHEATWNAICLADFGDKGVAFVAQPQIPPRNVNWSGSGGWVHAAKVGFEKYFIGKVKAGKSETFYENAVLGLIKTRKIKAH